MASLARFLLNDGRLFVIAADWNMDHGRLQGEAPDFMRALKARPFAPEQAEHTCYSGRLLDYVVAPAVMGPAMQVTIDDQLPWKAHAGIVTKVDRSIQHYTYKALDVPLALHTLPNKEGPAQRWKGPVQVQNSTRNKDTSHYRTIKRTPMFRGMENEMQELSEVYHSWNERAEMWLIQSKVCEREPRQYRGWGPCPELVEKPMPTDKDADNPAHGELAMLWGATAARLRDRWLRKCRDKGEEHQERLRKALRKLGKKLSKYIGRGEGTKTQEQATLTAANERMHNQIWLERLESGCRLKKEVLQGMVQEAENRRRERGSQT